MRRDKNELIKVIKEWVICIAISLILLILINKFVVFKIEVPTSSMYPTIKEDNQFLVTRIYNYNKLKTGDIIVFYSRENDDQYVKRLIGLPGDTVEIDGGKVSINGEELKEDYVENVDIEYSGVFEVPEDKYFFLGDNRTNSYDSRWWKNPYVDKKDLEAKVQIRVYPFSDFGFIE